MYIFKKERGDPKYMEKKYQLVLFIGILIIVPALVLSQSSTLIKIDKAIPEKADQVKEYFKDQQGNLYPYGMDTFYYLTQADYILGNREDAASLRLAPQGKDIKQPLYPYVIASINKLGLSIFWLPILLGIASTLLVFFIARTIYNTYTGLFAGLIFSFHPFFITWNYGGLADTNAINLFLSLLFMYCILKAYTKNFIWLIPALITIIMFFFTWGGAFYILIILSLIALTVKRTKLLIPSTILLIILLINYGGTILERLFPSKVTITELQQVNFSELLAGSGGVVMFSIMCVGVLIHAYLVWKKHSWKSTSLLVWFVPLIIAGIFSRRFLFYAAPPTALLLGTVWDRARQKLQKKIPPLVTILGLCLIIPLLLSASIVFLQHQTPFAHDAFVNTAQAIKQTTPKNTIITSWWDRGYLYQYYADRPTLVDPGTTHHQRIYTLASFFLETNESKAAEMLHSMRCGRDLNMNDCQPAVVLIDEKMLAHLTGEISRITKCKQQDDQVFCDNGFIIMGNEAMKDNAYPTRFDDYRGLGRTITNYNTTNNIAFVLYNFKKNLYGFMTPVEFTDTLLIRFIAQDNFTNFTLLHQEEFPEQVYAYKFISRDQ